MWIDGNVHGNEVQGGEAVLYTAWYLLENYALLPDAAALVDDCTFYLLPSQNPDGRAHWFEEANTAHSSRTGYQPHDDDRDGRFDEDPADDLDGDGQITQMRKYVPGQGNFRLDPDDPRLMIFVPPNDKGIKRRLDPARRGGHRQRRRRRDQRGREGRLRHEPRLARDVAARLRAVRRRSLPALLARDARDRRASSSTTPTSRRCSPSTTTAA